ncbi:MAG: DUF6345 domain-containing protein [Anaerolineales bacterium]
MNDLARLKWGARQLISGLLLLILLAGSLPPAGLAQADGQLAQQPPKISIPDFPDIPEFLPVYRLPPQNISSETVTGIAAMLGGLGLTDVFTETAYTGAEFYRGVNSRTGAVLEQYRGGGFLAQNPNLGFEEVEANLDYGPSTICNYLLQNEFMPADTKPEAQDCRGNLPYTFQNIYNSIITPTLTTQTINGPQVVEAITKTLVIGQIWQVPLAINTAPDEYVPLGGPGGHLSLLLTGYDNRAPIDPDLTGLQGLAMPWYNRAREVIDTYPVVPAAQAYARALRSMQLEMPGAILDLGEPVLEYFVDDPAVDQQSMYPVWYFPDGTAMVDGEEVNLRGFTIPAVDGFLPEVAILDPVPASAYLAGQSLGLTAEITGGLAPYAYTFKLEDGTPLASGIADTPLISTATDPLPPINRFDTEDVRLILDVQDANGAPAADQVELVAPNLPTFLPTMNREAGATPGGLWAAGQPAVVQAPDATRRMGVHYIEWYNGVAADLHGVPPDGNGFYNGLKGLGWQGVYKYPNNAAWEKDWRDCTLGGIDCTYGVDRVDFAYFSGHGSSARIYFGVSKDSTSFFGGDARYQNLRYAAFSSCQTLRAGPYVGPGNPPLTYWFNAFQGAYMLFGFHTNMADVAFGPRLIQNAKPFTFLGFTLWQSSLREAWANTAFQMNAGGAAYLYARRPGFDPVNFKLPDSSASLPPLTGITSYHWVWWGN